MECPVVDSHWDGEMALNPDDNLYYCPKHVTRCTISSCERKFFDGELTLDFICGARCVSCPGECTPFWCDEHIPKCQICEELSDLCEPCAQEISNGVYLHLCEDCCTEVMDNPCSFALVKKAK